MIPNSKDWFISTADHYEWGVAHTVWGEVGVAQRSLQDACNAGALGVSYSPGCPTTTITIISP